MKQKYFFLAIILLAMSSSCKKEFLEAKPDDSLVVPTTLQDLQALLDDDRFMNGSPVQSTGGPNPALLVTAGDEYYVLDAVYNALSLYSKNGYLWSKDDVYGGAAQVPDWSVPYRAVFYANTALEGLNRVPVGSANETAWKNIRGSALFYRAHTFYQLLQVFAPVYTNPASDGTWGIPLRMQSDINEPIERATVEQSYARVLEDLKESLSLLPRTPLYKTRPSQAAALALLARTYLTMNNYDSAARYASECLQQTAGFLSDYNTLSTTATYPLLGSSEIIFTCCVNSLPSTELWTGSKARVDSLLYRSYAANDLRRSVYFLLREPGRYSFRGSYEGSGFLFTGLAVDEFLLIRAECAARRGDKAVAMADLNTLLLKRWKTGTFVPLTATDADDALTQVLAERRKELLLRGLRWTDLRRLNREPRFAKSLARIVNGQTLTLPPNDLRYVWPIPPDVIGFHPTMPQNPR